MQQCGCVPDSNPMHGVEARALAAVLALLPEERVCVLPVPFRDMQKCAAVLPKVCMAMPRAVHEAWLVHM